MDRFLIGRELVALDPVLALDPAVVGEEDDQGVAVLVGPLEDPDQLGDMVVDREQGAQPALVVELELMDLGIGHARQLGDEVVGIGRVAVVEGGGRGRTKFSERLR